MSEPSTAIAHDPPIDRAFARKCRRIAMVLILLLPLLRIAEAGGRLLFLPDCYDSFRHALTAEMWFSDLWILYLSTSFGKLASGVVVLWLVAIPVVLVLPSVAWRRTFCVGAVCLSLIVLEVVTG